VAQRRPTTSLDEDPDQDRYEWIVDEGERPEAYAERQELGRAIQRGLDTLPPEQRAVVVLADIQGMQYDEVAEAMGISLGTVKSRLNRGRRKLRDYLVQHAELLPARYRLHDEAGGVGGLASWFLDWHADWLLAPLRGRGVHRDE
jgi:RNA polymerase sigma-70 factor (ECF subfamily)